MGILITHCKLVLKIRVGCEDPITREFIAKHTLRASTVANGKKEVNGQDMKLMDQG